MRTAYYIEELLYRYNCVIVPGFGAFLTQVKSAEIQKSTNTFYPPTKVISFNEQLSSNDGLLIAYMADAEKVSYDEMLEKIETTVLEWKNILKEKPFLAIGNIGKLSLNSEGSIQFNPANKVNFLTSSYGLSSYTSNPITREILKEEVETLEETIPFIITPEKRETSSFRPFLKYAAIGLLLIATGLSSFQFYNENINTDEIVQHQAQEQISRNLQEATFFSNAPLELPSLTLDLIKKKVVVENAEIKNHHIIAGAFRVRKNADKKVAELKRKGYDASYIGANKYGLHQVTFGSYSNVDEALTYLKKIKSTVSKEAWLFSE